MHLLMRMEWRYLANFTNIILSNGIVSKTNPSVISDLLYL